MAGTTGMERVPYRRRPESEWAVIRAMYREGATAKALALRFGGTERSIYTHLSNHDCLRRDQATEVCALDDGEVRDAVREARGCEADAPVRALAEGASLGEAAQAAASTAIAMLRDAQPTRSYTYARLAGTLERLARGAVGDGGGGADPTEPGRVAALDFLRREGVIRQPDGSPFPLEGGRVGDGGKGAVVAQDPGSERSGLSRDTRDSGGFTPTQPSPLEGEGS